MAHVTQAEFNMIRELLGPSITGKAKYSTYAQNVQDAQLKQVLQRMSISCEQKAKTLLGFL